MALELAGGGRQLLRLSQSRSQHTSCRAGSQALMTIRRQSGHCNNNSIVMLAVVTVVLMSSYREMANDEHIIVKQFTNAIKDAVTVGAVRGSCPPL